ncbi:unnamed protein product [Meloidogyne enterolobii]|uniref:Uncharacterized protein n=1 Tax=Meloidogyne enterolobii TaxID=390850 RepID=A0ACB1ABE5_MELEN
MNSSSVTNFLLCVCVLFSAIECMRRTGNPGRSKGNSGGSEKNKLPQNIRGNFFEKNPGGKFNQGGTSHHGTPGLKFADGAKTSIIHPGAPRLSDLNEATKYYHVDPNGGYPYKREFVNEFKDDEHQNVGAHQPVSFLTILTICAKVIKNKWRKIECESRIVKSYDTFDQQKEHLKIEKTN